MTDSTSAHGPRDDVRDKRAQVDWQEAHAALVRLARSRAGLDFDEGLWLLAALRSEAHVRLGYGSFVEYAERIFGYAPRLTREKLRVAESLEGLPELAQALRDGAASWSSLRELTRVATPETERAWLERARRARACGTSSGSSPVIAPAACPMTRRTPARTGTCCASKSRAKLWRHFVKRWLKSGAKRADRSTTTRRCC